MPLQLETDRKKLFDNLFEKIFWMIEIMGAEWISIMNMPYKYFEKLVSLKDDLEVKKRNELNKQVKDRENLISKNEAKTKMETKKREFLNRTASRFKK